MSKVLVDRELLERIDRCYMDGMSIYGECEEIRAILAQPAGAEGVDEFDARCLDKWLRQYCHNDGSPGFVFGYEAKGTEQLVDRLRAALSAVTADRDRLESMLIRTATRHFALQIKDRADDKKLDECLSEGIAMLEAERDQLRAEVEELRPIHAMILNALDRDAEEGKTARGEMAAELRAAMAAKEV